MDDFDDETNAFISRIHKAWRSKAALTDYVKVRDKILARQDHLDVQISALTSVIRLVLQRDHESPDATWQDFLTLGEDEPGHEGFEPTTPLAGRKRRRNYHESTRRRNVAATAAVWSVEVVHHYKWDQAGQGQIRIIRACATRFPDFEADFVPRLNSILLARHCSAVGQGQGRTLNEARLQPYRDFNLELLAGATIDLEWEHQWLTSRDGAIRLDAAGTLLSHVRPEHFRLYLLKKDGYGLLDVKAQPEGHRDNFAVVTPSPTREDLWSPSSRPRSAGEPACAPALSRGSPYARCVGDLGPEAVELEHADARPICSPTHALRFDDVTMVATPASSVFELRPSSADQLPASPLDLFPPSSVIPGIWADPRSPQWPDSAVSFPSLRHSLGTRLTRQSSGDFEPHAVELRLPGPDAPDAREGLDHRSARMDPFMPEHRRESSCKEPDLTYWPGSREDTGVESHWGGLEASSPSPATIGADPPRYSTGPGSGHESQLLISAPEVQRDGELALEEQLHNKHHGNLKSYVERLSEQMGEGQRFTRAQWLTHDTAWARIWCPDRSPGVGRARCEDDADVLCYTAAQFNAHADTAQQFGRPIIIKQDFSDHSMHSIPHFLTMLQDSCHHGMLDVRGLDSKVPMSMLTEQFVNAAQSPSNGHGGLAVLNLPNLTKAHRPLFTMLPRFQLLETLTKRLCKGTSRRISSLSIDPSACVDFNVIRLAEAFSGADVNSVSGTWFRILDGTEYWMIVSAVEMDLEWDNFASEGDEWLPHGKERLIVLEKGDVLLMPPGCPIVHAVHSPSGSLVEGGSLWDEHNMISTLQSVLEACGSQLANNKILNLPLARIMDNLRELVSTHPDKFQGSLDRANMLSIIDKTVLALRDTDYICIDPL